MSMKDRFVENPTDIEAFYLLEEEYSTSENWEELLSLYNLFIKTNEVEITNKYLFKKTILLDEILEKPQDAVFTLKSVISNEEFNLAHLKYFEALTLSTSQVNELIDTYKIVIPKVEDDDMKLLLNFKTASAYLEQNKPIETAGFVDAILDIEPMHEDSLDLLDFMLNKYNSNIEFLRRVTSVYEKIEDWDHLLEVYNYIISDKSLSKEETLAVLDKKVELLETVLAGEEELLFDALLLAYSLDTNRLDYFEKLEYYTQMLDFHEKLVEKLIELYKDDKKPFLAYKIGLFSYSILSDENQGQYYLTLYVDDLGEKEYYEDAFTYLIEMLEAKESYTKLVVTILKQAKFIEDATEKIEKYQEAARLYEDELDSVDSAIKVYEKIVAFDEENLSHRFRLEELYEKNENWTELLKTIDFIIENVDDKESYYKKRALIYHDKLNDKEIVVNLYKEFLEEYGYTENSDIVERLTSIYREKELFSDLKEFLVNYKNYVEDSEELENVNYEIAEIAANKFEDYDEAYERLTEILSIATEHRPSLKMLFQFIQNDHKREESFEYLSSLFDMTDNIPYWIKLNQLKMKVTTDIEEKATLSQKIGYIYNERAGEPEKAFPYIAKRFELSPSVESYEDFKEHYELTGMYEEAVVVMKEVTKKELDDDELKEVLNFELAKLLYFNLDQTDAAEPYLKVVSKINPENLEALTMLDEIYTESGNQEALLEVLVQKVELEEDKIETYYRLRDISLEHLQDKEKTLVFLKELYELDQYNAEDHGKSIIAFMKELKQYKDLGEFYERILEVESNPEYIEELADLYYDHLDNKERAKELYEQVVDITENRIKVLSNLETLCEESGENDRLIEILEDKFEEFKANRNTDGSRGTIFKLGKLYLGHSQQYKRAKKMFSYLIKADYKQEEIISYLELYLENEEALPYISDELASFYTQQEEWYSLVKLYKIESDILEEKREERYLEIAEIYKNNLKNIDEAVKYYNKSFKLSQDFTLFKSIENLLKENKNYTGLLALYEEHLKDNEIDYDNFRTMLYLKSAKLYQKFDKNSLAIKILLEGHESDESNVKIIDMLIDISIDNKDNEKAKEFYYKKLELVDDETEKVDLTITISRFIVEKFHDFKSGITILLEVLEWDPFNEKVIEIILKLNEHVTLDDYEFKLDIINKLKPIFIDNMQYKEMESLYESIIGLDGLETEQQIELIKEEIEFFFEVAQYEDGMKKYKEALVLSEGESSIIKMGAGYAELTNDFNSLLAIYKEFLSKTKSLDKAIEVYLVMGEISYKYLGDLEKAEKYFAAILSKKPDYLDLFYILEEIYEAEGEYEKLADVYLKQVALIDDSEKKIELYKKIALLLDESMYDPEKAIPYFEKIIELDPKDEESLEKLFIFYKEQKDNESILKVLDNYLLIYPEDSMHLNRATFFYLKNYKKSKDESKLKRATELIDKAYSIDPDNRKTGILLVNVYKDAEKHTELIDFYKQKLESSDDESEQIDINVELATLYAVKMNDISSAEQYINNIEEMDPYNVKILDIKEQILIANKDWTALLELLESKMNVTEDEAKVDDIIFSKVKILTEHFSEYDEALDDLKILIEHQPNNSEFLFYSEKIYLAMDDLKGYFSFIKGHVPETEDEELKANILVKMGDIAYTNFSKESLAIKCYNKAIDFMPELLTPIIGLKTIAKNNDDYDTYVNLLKQEFDSAKGERKAELKEELIDVYVNKLNRPEEVIPFKEEEFQNDDSLENMLNLIELYSVSSQDFNFFEYFDSFFEKLKADKRFKERHIYMHKLGMACQNFGDTDNAKKCFEITNRFKMGYIPNQMSLGKLLMDMGDSKGALKAFQLLQLNHSKIKDVNMKIELFLRIGRLRKEANDKLRAKSMYKKVLTLDPNNEEALDFLT